MTIATVKRKITPSNAGGLVSFLTVARASVNRMLDAPLSMVGQWIDGQPLYSSSFGGADWHWQADFPAATATDNETTCRPTSWIAGGLNGAAVRNLEGNRASLSQTTWRIDSAAADNEGSGGTLDPLKTDAEIQRRWGPQARIIAGVAVSISYVQSPTTTTNLFCQLPNNSTLSLIGNPTISKAGTVLTAVQTQVRTAGAELGWAVTAVGLAAADVGKIMVITASGTPGNVGAYAAVLKDETGGKVRVSPFGKFSFTTNPFAAVTPLVGDTIELRDMSAVSLTVGTIEVVCVADTTLSGSNAICYLALRQLTLNAASQFQGGVCPVRVPAFYDQCDYQAILLGGTPAGGLSQHRLCGGYGRGAIQSLSLRPGAAATFSQVGFTTTPSILAGAICTFQSDCYFQNCPLIVPRGAAVTTNGVAFFDRVTSNSALNVNTGAQCVQTGAVPDWGTANAGHGIVVFSSASYTYATKPTINGTLGAGREVQLGGVDLLYAAVPAITAANNAALVLTA